MSQIAVSPSTRSSHGACYPYTRLNQDEIRILVVDRTGQGNHKLYAHIPFSSDESPSYWALSYTWGDSNNPREIRVDGHAVHISRNLDDALNAIITAYREKLNSSDHYLPLWADQICINQNDIAEKNQQVAMMSYIYQKAALVLVWLPAERSHPAGDISNWLKWLMDDTKRPGTSRIREPETTQRWDQVLDIVQNSWWSRAWVYQEFMLGKEVSFLVGAHLVTWNDLRVLLQLYHTQLTRNVEIEESNRETMKETLSWEWPRSYILRCHLCHQIKGVWLLRLLSRDPAIWWTVILCCISIRLLPEYMARKTIANVIARNTFHTRRSISSFLFKISTCECMTDADDNPAASYWPDLVRWKRKSFYTKWLLSITRDRVCWWQVHMIILHGFMGFLGHITAVRQLQIGEFMVSFMVASHLLMVKLPEAEYNDSIADSPGPAEFSSWANIDKRSWRFWKLALSILDQRAIGSSSITLSTVIEHARSTRSTDPRDKVYAFLGLMGTAAYKLNVNYAHSNKIETVLTEAAEQIVMVEGSLDFLRLAIEDRTNGFDSGQLPSWVPNWSRPRLVLRSHKSKYESLEDLKSIMQPFTHRIFNHTAEWSGHTKPAITFRTDGHGRRILQAQALHINTLGANLDSNVHNREHAGQRFGVRDIVSSNYRVYTGDEIWLILGCDMLLILRNSRFTSASEYFNGNGVTKSITGLFPNATGVFRSPTYKLVGEAISFGTVSALEDALLGGGIVLRTISIRQQIAMTNFELKSSGKLLLV